VTSPAEQEPLEEEDGGDQLLDIVRYPEWMFKLCILITVSIGIFYT
jgi:hypothetical protein